MVSGDALRSFMIVAAGAIVLAVCMRGRLKAGVAIGAIGAIVLLDLFTVDKRYVDSESFVAKRLAWLLSSRSATPTGRSSPTHR